MTPKVLTSLCLVLAGIGPLLLDIGDTHLFNPNWDEHSRVHEVWRLATNSMIAFLGLYLIWKKKHAFNSITFELVYDYRVYDFRNHNALLQWTSGRCRN